MRTALELPDGMPSSGVADTRNGVVFDDCSRRDTIRLAALEVMGWQRRLRSSRRQKKGLLRYG